MSNRTKRNNPRSHPAEFRAEDSLRHQDIPIRPRYPECDPMGVVHHSVYPVWFEMGRTEMLRSDGGSYRELEAAGVFLVVADLSIRFRRPARYDDELTLRTHLLEGGRARIRHGYELTVGQGSVLATATTTIACVDSEGRLQPIPDVIEVMGA